MDEKSSDSSQKKIEDPAGSYTTYLEYNKVLRTWFVAFGVGGPALFLINEKIAERLAKAGMLKEVAIFFLAGATAQVVGALLNKVSNWYVYMSAFDKAFEGTCQHRLSEWFTHQFWFDITIDLVSIGCFGVAAWRMLTLFA